jgi:hypothetical protein
LKWPLNPWKKQEHHMRKLQNRSKNQQARPDIQDHGYRYKMTLLRLLTQTSKER